MNKLPMKELELWVDNTEELYWWGVSYCKEHKCTVHKFIRENYEEIKEIIQRHGGKI